MLLTGSRDRAGGGIFVKPGACPDIRQASTDEPGRLASGGSRSGEPSAGNRDCSIRDTAMTVPDHRTFAQLYRNGHFGSYARMMITSGGFLDLLEVEGPARDVTRPVVSDIVLCTVE